MQICKCDRCGSIVDKPRGILGKYGANGYADKEGYYDLCEKCYNDLSVWLKSPKKENENGVD